MSYYTRVKTFLRNTLAKGSDIRFELDALASALSAMDVAHLNAIAAVSSGTDAKINYSATAAPTVNDDSDDGYSPGSRWLNLSTAKAYICLDATVGAAVWYEFAPKQITAGEITAGTETALRATSPANMKSMIETHAPAPTINYQSRAKGLRVVRASATEVTVTANEIIFDDGQVATGVNVTIDITDAAQKNGRGDSVSESNSTWYYVCLSHDGGTVYGWFDTDSGGANDPDDTDDAFLYAGAAYNDSGGDLHAFVQVGSRVSCAAPINTMVSGGTATTMTLTSAATAPSHVRWLRMLIHVTGGVTAAAEVGIDGTNYYAKLQDTASGDSNKDLRTQFDGPCDNALKVYYRKNSGNAVTIECIGWVDHKVAA